MKSKFSLRFVIVFSFMLWVAVIGYAELVVYIDQPAYHITRNDEITLSINIEGVAADMRGYQLEFAYDPEYLEIAGVSSFHEGGFLSEFGRTGFYISGEPGNYLVGGAILGITYGALGSGNLFTVTMKAIKATDELGTDVLLNNVILRDPLNNEIQEDRVDGSNVVIDRIMMYCRTKAFLHGAYITGGSMRYNLTSYLPLVSPYNSAEQVTTLPDVTPNFIVDWVQLQLRATFNGAILQSQSCFLLQNGSVVDATGNPTISFEYLDLLEHYIILRHRNHLGVMSANVHSFTMDYGTAPLIDLTALNSIYGGNLYGARQVETGVLAMYTGDSNRDGRVNNTDRASYWTAENGLTGYVASDYNLNGIVQNSDVLSFWSLNNGRISQIP